MGSLANRRNRGGYTLMEIALVLAIFVAVAAAAVPIYHGTLRRERVRKVAEAIAADWTRTRATAIETGQTQLWVCTMATGAYSASPYSSGSSPLTNAEVGNLVGQTPGAGMDAQGDFGETLPQGVTISQILVSDADTMVAMGASTNSAESGTGTLFFYPDGTSSSARVVVRGEDDASMAAVLVGTAGLVRVFPVESDQ